MKRKLRVPRRKWLRLASGILLILALVGATSSCDDDDAPADVMIVSAQDLGVIPTNPDIVGRDGANSALFQGDSVWLYGDTFLAQANAQNRTLISDSWSFTADLSAQNGIGDFEEHLDSAGEPTMILPESPAEQAYNQAHNGNVCQEQPCGARWALWPTSMVVDAPSNQAFIFYMLVSARPGDFNFQSVGSSVATWSNFQKSPQRPDFNPPIVSGHSDLMFSQSEPGFGTAALISNGLLYAYGCQVPNDGADKRCRLGRVEPVNILDRGAWSFYAGDGHWSSQVGDAVSVFEGSSIVSVYWNRFLQRYVALYSKLLSDEVAMRTSPNPEGPWSDEIIVFTAMKPVQGTVYDAHLHPEYDVNGGQTIYVSYSRGTGTFSSEVRLVAIQLASRR